MRQLVIAITLLGSASFAHAAKPLDDIIDGVQGVYKRTRNFKAAFDQKLILRATKRRRRAGGRVYFQKPNRFRFVYNRGQDKKVIVSNGRRVWTFLRDEAQVRIDRFSQKLAASLRFLWGEGDLRKQFHIKKLEGSKFGRDADHKIQLTPKEHEGYYRKLVFVVDPQTFEVRETIVYDPVGNINQMRFRKVKRNISIPARAFRFKIPKGAKVVRSPELKRKG